MASDRSSDADPELGQRRTRAGARGPRSVPVTFPVVYPRDISHSGDLASGLSGGLAALRSAIVVARDPLASGPLLPDLAFRALPRPRSTGATPAPAAGSVTTLTT